MQNEQILKELKEIRTAVSGMQMDIGEIKERLEYFYLSEDEKKDVEESLELHKNGKLLTKKDVFG